MSSVVSRGGLVCLAFVCGGWLSPLALGQWSNAMRFDLGESTCKSGGVAAASGGGFHGLYLPGNGRVRYRRYYPNGTLSSPSTVFQGTVFSSQIAESLNGEIHIAFEDWSAGPNNVRWFKSSDAGASFNTTLLLTDVNCAKYPLLAPFGMGQSPDMVMSYYRSGEQCDESLWYRRYNGSTWGPEIPLGSSSLSEFDCFGMARSPVDGSIYRTFGPSQTTMAYRRFDGAWGPQTQIYSGPWAVRQHMAINAAGQVMMVWDDMSRIKAMLYTPGSGSAPVVDLGVAGYRGACDVCAIPGTNDFYMVVARDMGGDSNFHVYGRRWSAGAWQNEESVQNGQANAFIVTPFLAADLTGTIYCVWEYWVNGVPQQWFAIRPGPPDPRPKGTLSGTVRDAYNASLPGAMVLVQNVGPTMTTSNGTYSVQVPAGTHTVQASKLHYNASSAPAVSVTANTTTTLDFSLSTTPPAPVPALNVAAGNRENHLSWTAPPSGNFSGVLIRYSTTGVPSGPTDGQLLIELAGAPDSPMSFLHSGLVNGRAYHYAVFSYFQDASRFYNLSGVPGSGTPAGPGDYDRDGDVDQADFGLFQLCLSGNYIPQPAPACQAMKFDADDDVDQFDVEGWQWCFSGPGVPSNPLCRN